MAKSFLFMPIFKPFVLLGIRCVNILFDDEQREFIRDQIKHKPEVVREPTPEEIRLKAFDAIDCYLGTSASEVESYRKSLHLVDYITGIVTD